MLLKFNRSQLMAKRSYLMKKMGNHAKRHLIFNASSKRCTTLDSTLLPFWIMYGTNCEQFPRGVMNTNFEMKTRVPYSFSIIQCKISHIFPLFLRRQLDMILFPSLYPCSLSIIYFADLQNKHNDKHFTEDGEKCDLDDSIMIIWLCFPKQWDLNANPFAWTHR